MTGDAEFSIVMPFVVVKSKGGPYDDGAYVAGWEMGALAARLDAAKHFNLGLPEVVVHIENVPQVDLLAMRVGARMVVREWGAEIDEVTASEWAHVVFEWAEVEP